MSEGPTPSANVPKREPFGMTKEQKETLLRYALVFMLGMFAGGYL